MWLTRRRTRANVGLFSRRRFSQEFAGMICFQGMTIIAGSVLDVPLGPMFHFPLARLPLNNSSWASALLACS
jgi:hypothetical protein